MQSQLRLRWLLREARTPGVILSNQIGMTVHALRRLDLLTVASSSSTATSMLPVIKSLCVDADGRSQVNILHALACATSEQCSPRVTLQEELCDTLRTLQAALVEQINPLTSSETILAMEALVKLAPFAGDQGTIVSQRLLDEVQERTVALATVVERSVDLLGVARVAVEAATSAAAPTPSSSLSIQALTSVGTASWATATLEQVLLVVHARLSTFTKQDLISLVDALTVRRALPEPTAAEVSDAASSSSLPSPPSAYSATTTKSDAAVVGGSGTVFLDAARFLLGDLLDLALTTVPNLSVAQLTAWLARLVNLQLTEHALLNAVVTALVGASRAEKEFSIPQLSSVCTSLTALLPIVVAATGTLPEKETYLRAYVQMMNLLVTSVHSRDRTDPDAAELARDRILPLLCSVPEAALDAYLTLAAAADGRMGLPRYALAPDNCSVQVRIFVVLSASLAKGAAFVLRFFDTLTPREQAQAVAFAFHWRFYMPTATVVDAEAVSGDSTAEAIGNAAAGSSDTATFMSEETGPAARVPTAIEMVCRSSFLNLQEAARKHRALCGLVESRLANWGPKDVVQVLNEVVVSHHKLRSAALRQPQPQSKQPSILAQEEPEKSAQPISAAEQQALVEVAAEERCKLFMHLLERLLGPLKDNLKEIHTAQLVRCLSSMSKMNVRTRASYNTVLLLLKGRSLTGFEQISVLGVLARHHLRSPYVVYGVIRNLKELGQKLHTRQKVLVLRFLGQVGAQRLVKAPCAEGLLPGNFFLNAEELTHLSVLELVFCFSGLIELRQNANPTTKDILTELIGRVSPTLSSGVFLSARHTFHAVRSPTAMTEFLASLCRYGGPAHGVTAALLLDAMGTVQHRLNGSRSLFVDITQLTWYWPCVSLYFELSSVLWSGCTPAPQPESTDGNASSTPGDTFSIEEWGRLKTAFTELNSVAQQQLRRRLQSIADSPQLRPNTFLWNQMACGIRFDALPPRGSDALRRLWNNLDRNGLAPLLSNPQQLLDVMTVALHRLPEDEADAALMLRFVRKHIASLRLQDSLQVWYYASKFLTAPQHGAALGEKSRLLLQSVHTAAKEATMREEDAVREKLSVMEQRIFASLL